MLTRSWLLSLFLLLAGCGAAQGDHSNDPAAATALTPAGSRSGADATSTVSGTVVSPPFNGLGASMLSLGVVVMDPNTHPAKVLGSTTLNANDSVCTIETCTFSIANVDLSQVTAGVVIYTMDGGTTDTLGAMMGAGWVTVSTTTATQGDVEAAVTSGKLTNQYAFAVNSSGLAALGRVSKVTPAEELVTKGALIGLAVGSRNEVNATSGVPPLVSGATTKVPTGVTLSYPNDQFDGTLSATGKSGAFIAVPGTTPLTETYTLSPAATDTVHTWSPEQVSITGGVLQVVVFEADVEG